MNATLLFIYTHVLFHSISQSTLRRRVAVARLTRKVSLRDCELIRILRHAITTFIEDVIPTNRTIRHALQSPGTFRDGDRSVLGAVNSCALFNRLLLIIKCRENQYHIYL